MPVDDTIDEEEKENEIERESEDGWSVRSDCRVILKMRAQAHD